MSLVIADTGPVHYLILIEQISLLPILFENVVIPTTVRNEMLAPKTPDAVREWILRPPAWLQVFPDPASEADDAVLDELDEGEQAALRLAVSLQATLVLMDDRAGVVAAKRKGLLVTGTLGVLDLAAERSFIQIEAAIERLAATNFRYSQRLIESIVEKHRRRIPRPNSP
jgi:predicted nucleic acid-binding protein